MCAASAAGHQPEFDDALRKDVNARVLLHELSELEPRQLALLKEVGLKFLAAKKHRVQPAAPDHVDI